MRKTIVIALICFPLLGGCVKGIFPDPEADAKKVEDEAAATGSGCRQAGRSLEECFSRNEGLNRKGAVRGWQDMDEYMRVNKIQPQPVAKDLMDKESALKDTGKGSKEAKDEPAKDAAKDKESTPKAAQEKEGASAKDEKKP